jgi:serine/threonine-protein kinase HipA
VYERDRLAVDHPVVALDDEVLAGAKFQDPAAPRDSHRPSAYRIAEFLGSLQGEGRPVADFLRRLTFTVLLGDHDAHAKNVGILHLPGRSVLADVYDAVPNLFQRDRINYDWSIGGKRTRRVGDERALMSWWSLPSL